MKRFALLAMTFTLLLTACEINNPPPAQTPPPDTGQPDPGTPGEPGNPGAEMFNHLGEANWETDLLQGKHSYTTYSSYMHVNDDGVLFFVGTYIPDPEDLSRHGCAQMGPCSFMSIWTINPDGTERAQVILNHPDYADLFPGLPGTQIQARAALEAPNGNAYILGVFNDVRSPGAPGTAFVQEVSPSLSFVGAPITLPHVFDDFVLSEDLKTLYHTGIDRGTAVWATSLDTGSQPWRTVIDPAVGTPLSIVLNGNELHVLAQSPESTPANAPSPPRNFFVLDSQTGELLSGQPLPTATSEDGHPVADQPRVLVVDAQGRTQMYFQEIAYIPTGAGARTAFGEDIIQITFQPDTQTLSRSRIEFFDKNGIRFPPPVVHALADGNVLLAVNSYLNHALVAVNSTDEDSPYDWVHILYPRSQELGSPQTEPKALTILALTYHPTYGYYVLANHEEGAPTTRYARYRVINYR